MNRPLQQLLNRTEFLHQRMGVLNQNPAFDRAVLIANSVGAATWTRRATVSLWSYLTTAQIADAQTGNPTLDASAAFQAAFVALADGDVLDVPKGVYLCADLTPIAPAITIRNVVINGHGSIIRRPDATGAGAGNYAWHFRNFHHIDVNAFAFERNNTATANVGFNGVQFESCDFAVCAFCDFSDCLWGMVSAGVARHNMAYRCFSDTAALTYSDAAFAEARRPEFIYRVFGLLGAQHCIAMECVSLGASMVFQPNDAPYSKSIDSVSVGCWASPIYGASDHFESRGDVVINAGKDGIKINEVYRQKESVGGVITGAVIMGCGKHQPDGGQCISIAACDARVHHNYIELSPIAQGIAPEQNGILLIGNRCNVSDNDIVGAATASKEGTAILMRGRYYVNGATHYALGSSGHRGAGNTARNTASGVAWRNSSLAVLTCSDNQIGCDCDGVSYPVDVYGTVGMDMADNAFSGIIKGAVIGCTAIGSTSFTFSATLSAAAVTGASVFKLSNSTGVRLLNVISDGTYSNYSVTDGASTVALMQGCIDIGGIGKNVSQRFQTMAIGIIHAEGNTELRTNTINSVLTLDAGQYLLQRKMLFATFISAGNTVVVNGAFSQVGATATSITFSTANTLIELRWDGAAWQIINTHGVTVA